MALWQPGEKVTLTPILPNQFSPILKNVTLTPILLILKNVTLTPIPKCYSDPNSLLQVQIQM